MMRSFFIVWLLAPLCLHAQGAAYPSCSGGILFEFQVDAQARFIADSTFTVRPTASVRNPPNLVQFVVDTLGTIVPGSFRVIRVTDRALVLEAKQISERWRYRPAMSAGHAVCQLIQAPVDASAPHP